MEQFLSHLFSDHTAKCVPKMNSKGVYIPEEAGKKNVAHGLGEAGGSHRHMGHAACPHGYTIARTAVSHSGRNRAPQNLCLPQEPNTALCCHGLAQADCLPVDSKITSCRRESPAPQNAPLTQQQQQQPALQVRESRELPCGNSAAVRGF